jgi:uncharacterized repeat protein (TIGR04052 family)
MAILSDTFSLARILKPLTLVSVAVLVTACSNSDSDVQDIAIRTVAVPFEVYSGSTQLDCVTRYEGSDALGTDFREGNLTDFRMYVHDIKVTDQYGNISPFELDETDYQTDGVALLDMGCYDGASTSNMRVSGSYTGGAEVAKVSFTVGVPERLNHENAATQPAPLNVTGMQWAWASGYRFMRVEGNFDPAEVAEGAEKTANPNSFVFHLGSTDCVGNPALPEGDVGYAAASDVICSNANRPLITLEDADFSAQSVKFDIQALIGSTTLEESNDCHSFGAATKDLCVNAFNALGLDIATGEADASAQTAFSL